MERVVVVGASGSGKTTFAAELARELGSPHVELDAIHWGPDWTPPEPDEFRARVREALVGSRWVVDGNYSVVRDVVWPRATAVVWLDYSYARVLWQGFRRTVRRAVTRERLYSGNTESLLRAFFRRDSILLWMLTSFHPHRRSYTALRASGRYRFVVLSSPVQARAFLAAVDSGVRGTVPTGGAR